jgi:hypothetical protein
VEAEGGLGGERVSQIQSVRVKGRRERVVKTEEATKRRAQGKKKTTN